MAIFKIMMSDRILTGIILLTGICIGWILSKIFERKENEM